MYLGFGRKKLELLQGKHFMKEAVQGTPGIRAIGVVCTAYFGYWLGNVKGFRVVVTFYN